MPRRCKRVRTDRRWCGSSISTPTGRSTMSCSRRAVVRSRPSSTTRPCSGRSTTSDPGTRPEVATLLAEVGRLRQDRAAERGAVSLPLPDQEVVIGADGHIGLTFRAPLPVEDWKRRSPLTGMAWRIMVDDGVGVLRTCHRPMGTPWPNCGPTPPHSVSTGAGGQLRRCDRSLDPAFPTRLRFAPRRPGCSADRATRRSTAGRASPHRGLRRRALRAGRPYAHVTAPLRRLVDRFANEVVLACCAGAEVADDVRRACCAAELMASARRRESQADSGAGTWSNRSSCPVMSVNRSARWSSESTDTACASGARPRPSPGVSTRRRSRRSTWVGRSWSPPTTRARWSCRRRPRTDTPMDARSRPDHRTVSVIGRSPIAGPAPPTAWGCGPGRSDRTPHRTPDPTRSCPRRSSGRSPDVDPVGDRRVISRQSVRVLAPLRRRRLGGPGPQAALGDNERPASGGRRPAAPGRCEGPRPTVETERPGTDPRRMRDEVVVRRDPERGSSWKPIRSNAPAISGTSIGARPGTWSTRRASPGSRSARPPRRPTRRWPAPRSAARPAGGRRNTGMRLWIVQVGWSPSAGPSTPRARPAAPPLRVLPRTAQVPASRRDRAEEPPEHRVGHRFVDRHPAVDQVAEGLP